MEIKVHFFSQLKRTILYYCFSHKKSERERERCECEFNYAKIYNATCNISCLDLSSHKVWMKKNAEAKSKDSPIRMVIKSA